MTSNRDDLEKALQQNLKLRRELGAEVAKAKSLRARHISDASRSRHDPSPKLTTSAARQGTRARAMFWALIGSLALALIAGLALGFAFGWIPRPWSGPL